MDKLRKPFFLAAVILIALTVSLEVGSRWLVKGQAVSSAVRSHALQSIPGIDNVDTNSYSAQVTQLNGQKPPGHGIPDMSLLDGLILFTVALIGAPFFIGDRIQGRLQGIITLIVAIVILLTGIMLVFARLFEVLLMLGLFVAAPFGTIAYIAKWGFFDRGGAQAALGLLMLLKLGFGVCLVLAHQRFLQNKGLVLILITSLVANLVVSFLHGLVPGFLVSITDGVAAIIVLILALIWAVFLLVGSIISVIKAIV